MGPAITDGAGRSEPGLSTERTRLTDTGRAGKAHDKEASREED